MSNVRAEIMQENTEAVHFSITKRDKSFIHFSFFCIIQVHIPLSDDILYGMNKKKRLQKAGGSSGEDTDDG